MLTQPRASILSHSAPNIHPTGLHLQNGRCNTRGLIYLIAAGSGLAAGVPVHVHVHVCCGYMYVTCERGGGLARVTAGDVDNRARASDLNYRSGVMPDNGSLIQ